MKTAKTSTAWSAMASATNGVGTTPPPTRTPPLPIRSSDAPRCDGDVTRLANNVQCGAAARVPSSPVCPTTRTASTSSPVRSTSSPAAIPARLIWTAWSSRSCSARGSSTQPRAATGARFAIPPRNSTCVAPARRRDSRTALSRTVPTRAATSPSRSPRTLPPPTTRPTTRQAARPRRRKRLRWTPRPCSSSR